MQLMRNRDALGGAVLVLVGLCISLYSLAYYDLGRLSQFGPGMMPFALGAVLTVLGFLVVIPALFQQMEEMPKIETRSLLVVLAAAMAFGLVVERAGLFPATFSAALISTFAEPGRRLLSSVILAAALGVLVVAIFRFGLGIHVSVARWPF